MIRAALPGVTVVVGVLLLVSVPLMGVTGPDMEDDDEYIFTVSSDTALDVTVQESPVTTADDPDQIRQNDTYENLSPAGKDVFERALNSEDGRVVLRENPPDDFEYPTDDGPLERTYWIDYQGDQHALTVTADYGPSGMWIGMLRIFAGALVLVAGVVVTLTGRAMSGRVSGEATGAAVGLGIVILLAMALLARNVLWQPLPLSWLWLPVVVVVSSVTVLVHHYSKKARS